MAIYIVGDIQGCFTELKALLAQVNFNAKEDELWAAGDLVARGPDSLATLRFLKSLGNRAKVVLGNHDLHLLAIYAGLKKAKKQDKLDLLLNASDIDELMEWLAIQPLLHKLPNENAFMSHAGLSPQWSIDDAIQQSKFVQQRLSSPRRNEWLSSMYGEEPNDWQLAKTEIEQFRYSINAFTRIRFCYLNKSLEFICKETPEKAPSHIKPWFELCEISNKVTWVFGHWAALMGKCTRLNTYALDTGCVWGQHLTMLRWEDKTIFTQRAISNKQMI
jgi:bis(5'-nucleosyl)-tetraphosphatase (symmetrical)